MSETWSYSTGRRGRSRVRVYERYPGSPIHVEWTGGKRQTLRNLKDIPITDKALAMKIAHRLSEKLEADVQKELARDLFGIPEAHTLKALLKRYHEAKEPTWGDKHTQSNRMLREWWQEQLGKDTQLHQISDPLVEDIVQKHGDANDWKPRTRQKYLRYILAAFRYARLKLKWITERDDLTAVDVPKADRGGPSYSRKEMAALLTAAPEVDWRVDLALNIAYDTASRSEAIRNLRASDYMGDGVMRFPAEWDKTKQHALVPLSATTRWKVEAALRRDEVKETGCLFPEDGKAIRYDRLWALLEDVEVKAKVAKVKRRAWHGVKRRAVTDIRAEAAKLGLLQAVSKQTRTSEETMRAIYEQDDMEPKQALAMAMEGIRERLRRGA